MIKLTKILAKNFMSYRNLDLTMEDRGLILISGPNTVGKSSIHSAVCWGLFGKTAKGLEGDSVVNWDVNQDCCVEVWLNDGRDIKVRRWRLDSDRGNDVEIEVNGNPFIGRQRDVQNLIDEVLKSNFPLFVNTTVFSEGDVEYLAKQTDKLQRELFKKFLNLGDYDIAAEKADLLLKKYQEEYAAHVLEGEKVKEKRELFLGLLKKAEEERHEFNNYKEGRLLLLRKDLEALEEPIAPNIPVVEDGLYEKLRQAISDQTSLKAVAEHSLSQGYDNIRNWDSSLVEVQNLKGRCSYCGQVVTPETVGRHSKELEDNIRREQKRMDVIRREIGAIDETIHRYTQEQDKVSAILQGNDELVQRYERVYEEYQRSKLLLESKIEELKSGDNPHIKNVESLKSQLSQLPDLEELSAKGFVLYEKCLYMEFVKDIYKPKGIQSYIIEQSFDFLNRRVNDYLSPLTEGQLSMSFEPMRKLKTKGEYREEITLQFVKNCKTITYNHLTDAERVGTNIAIIFALHDFSIYKGVSSFDFMFLDEILDLSLDAVRMESLTRLLSLIRTTTSSVFVISHREDLKEVFKNSWEVSIDGGQSQLQE